MRTKCHAVFKFTKLSVKKRNRENMTAFKRSARTREETYFNTIKFCFTLSLIFLSFEYYQFKNSSVSTRN